MSYKDHIERLHLYDKEQVSIVEAMEIAEVSDIEIEGLRELAKEYYNEAQDALCRIEDLEAKLANSIPREDVEDLIDNYNNHIEPLALSAPVVVESLINHIKYILSNQTR